MNPLKEIFKNKIKDIPVWFMRQAGRYLPEYRKIRKNNKNFIDFCLNINDAFKVTIQPLKRFNIDAAIVFSDILLILNATGQNVRFKEKEGPVLDDFNSKLFYQTTKKQITNKLNNVYSIIKKTKKNLPNNKSLIGFAGAPWTLYVYLKNRRSPKNTFNIKSLKGDYKIFEKLSDLIVYHCENQIKAGADIIQIFDSWAGLIPEKEFKYIGIDINRTIIKKLKKSNPKTPIIYFPKGVGQKINLFAEEVKPDGLSIDHEINLHDLNIDKNIVYQGGLNPKYLLLDEKKMLKEAEKYLKFFQNKRYIFNLGHGILPNTDPDRVKKLVNFVKNYQ